MRYSLRKDDNGKRQINVLFIIGNAEALPILCVRYIR